MREGLLAASCLALLALGALASCDQFARVGVEEAELGDSGPSSAPEPDAAPPASPDASVVHDAGAECPSVAIAVCDPVTNTGCPAGLQMQCAIDLLSTLGGYCTFSSPPPTIGVACFNSGVTESCPPTTTCYLESCHRICLCDADCDPGQCCNEPIESTGFAVCRDC